MIRNLIIFGTRPEAIKMAPLVKAWKNEREFDTKVCVTAQHREMLDQVLHFFDITPDYDLDVMTQGQNLHQLTAHIIASLKTVFDAFKPHYVFVHGDTTTTMAASLAAFYSGAKVCHVEAGLRTGNKRSPFPEEINRSITARIADWHFAPTDTSKSNLIKENIIPESIFVTGNTVIDALLYGVNKTKTVQNDEIKWLEGKISKTKKIILITGHRRENFGERFIEICKAIRQIAQSRSKDVQIVYPVHLNPRVRKPVYDILHNIDNVLLVEPLSYPAFVWLMNRSYLILTDSGGVQEEAPSLGKPVLVMRETTERPEAVKAGTVILVGANRNKIVAETVSLIENSARYEQMSHLHNPYGNGTSSEVIVGHVKQQIYK